MAKISTMVSDDLDAFFDTEDMAVNATFGGQTFAIQFFLEDADQEDIQVAGYDAYILARTSDVPGVARGIIVVLGTADALGEGMADDGEMMVDIGEEMDAAGQTTYYVSEIVNYGDDGLIKQIKLSRDPL